MGCRRQGEREEETPEIMPRLIEALYRKKQHIHNSVGYFLEFLVRNLIALDFVSTKIPEPIGQGYVDFTLLQGRAIGQVDMPFKRFSAVAGKSFMKSELMS